MMIVLPYRIVGRIKCDNRRALHRDCQVVSSIPKDKITSYVCNLMLEDNSLQYLYSKCFPWALRLVDEKLQFYSRLLSEWLMG